MSMTMTQKPEIIRNKPLMKVMDRLAELEDAANEYENLSKLVKDEMKEKGEGVYHCGLWRIQVKKVNRTGYSIPQEVKDQYQTLNTATFVEWRKH